jgi:ribosomal protein S18 acetylase RimI-like enzyme
VLNKSESYATMADKIVIGPMSEEEAECTSILFKEVVIALPYYNDLAKQSEIAKYSAALLKDTILVDPNLILVAKVGTHMAGFCISKPDDGLVWLSWIGVHPQFRRKRIGYCLLDKLEKIVKNSVSHKIWCDCRTENKASKQLLASRGYAQICTVTNHWYGQDFILWEKLV